MTTQDVLADFSKKYWVTTQERQIPFVVYPLCNNSFWPQRGLRVDNVIFTDGQQRIVGERFLTIEEKE